MDLDGDGLKDMLSGSFRPGDLYLFSGNGDRSFKAGQILKDKEGKPLNVGQASAVFAADWDADGDLDLLVGNIKGQLYWIANQSQTKVPVFASPRPVAIEGEALEVHRDTAPCVVDWDGDGQLDLLLGDGKGKVTFFQNKASSSGLPQLAPGRVLVAKGKYDSPGDHRGGYSRLFVTDWNQDGRLDLLLGDASMTKGPEPEMTEAQRAERDAAKAARKDISKKLIAIQQEYMREHGIQPLQPGQKRSDLQVQERNQLLKSLREDNQAYQALEEQSQAPYEIVKKYRAPTYYHGYVWVYLRSPAAAAVMEADAQRSEQ